MASTLMRNIDRVLAVIGLLVAMPAIYFFFGSLLKYKLNLLPNIEILVPSPFVMIGGLLLAVTLNIVSLYKYKTENNGKTFISKIKRKPLNSIVFFIAAIILVLLLSYVLVENIMESKVV